MASCSCIPPPASLKPRKIYNLLVPDVFSLTAPPLDEPVNTSTKRKIGKLQEYVQKNPGKAGKVSRRLTRRIKKALYDQELGYVKVAVSAYVCLLDKSTEEGSTYTFNYFSKELIHQPDTVIKTLLSYPKPEVQALGAGLLAAYIRAQSEFENQADANALLVEAAMKLPAATKAKGAGTNAAQLEGLQVACLEAVKEYVAFCHKIKILPALLEQIEALTLDIVEADEKSYAWLKDQASLPPLSQALSGSASLNGDPVRRVSQSSYSGASTDGRAGGVARPSGLAVAILRNFRPFLQEISSVRRVVEALLSWLDQGGRWERKELVEGLLALVRRSCGELTFPLTSALMRHAALPGLNPQQRAIVVRAAVEQDVVYSLSALNLAALELPRALAAAGPAADLQSAVDAAMAGLAKQVGDACQVAEALGAALKAHTAAVASGTSPGQTLAHALHCCEVALATLPSFPAGACHFPGRTLPTTLLASLTALISTSTSISQSQQPQPGSPQHSEQAALLLTSQLSHLGGPLRDDKQGAGLLCLVPSIPAVPKVLAAASRITAAVCSTRRPTMLLAAARLALHLGGGTSTGANQEGAAGRLLLCAALVGQLAESADCSGLLPCMEALHKPLKTLLPELHLQEQGQPQAGGEASLPTLVSTAHSWHAKQGGLPDAVSKIQSGASAWAGTFKRALMESSALSEEYSGALNQLLSQPLSEALPAGSSTHHYRGASGLPTGSYSGPSTSAAQTAAHVEAVGHGMGSGGAAGGSVTAANGDTGAQLSALLGQGSTGRWASRAASAKKERLNLAHVMDLLGGNDSEAEDGPQGPGQAARGQATAADGAVGSGVVAALLRPGASMTSPRDVHMHLGVKPVGSLGDALGLAVAALGQGPKAGSAQDPVQMSELARQLEPLVH